MSFGLTNAPTTFQSLINDLFRPYLQNFIIVFFDDILVYLKKWEDHLQHLQTVLTILSANNLNAKDNKCIFGVTIVEYLGYIISHGGVGANLAKIQAIQDWSTPTTI